MSIRYTADQLQRKFPGPAGSPGYARVADALRVEGRLDEAVAMCHEGLRARPLVAGYVVLGKTLMDAGRWEEAREQFEAALRLDPRCLSAMRSLALIMDKLQWADAAAGYYRSILEVEPWDAEIRALLEDSGSAGSGAIPAGMDTGRAPAAVPSDREEEGFPKPEGLHGDVMEVNLNDMADEFLPSGGELADPASLEDAFASATSHFPADDYTPAPDALAEPKPMDLLSASSGPETLGENAPAPISGSDVEERLDSLFGSEDGGTPSATATWTAAAPQPDALPEDPATATGEMRSMEADPGLPGEAAPFDLATLPEVSDFPEAAASDPEILGNAFSDGPEATTGTDVASIDEDARVQGEDIERRLDELFDLGGEDDVPKPSAASASDLPLAPGPDLGETVVLGEPVAFGDRPADVEAHEGAQAGEVVTGQDVADKLDSMLGPDPQAKAAGRPDSDPFARDESASEASQPEAALAEETPARAAGPFAELAPRDEAPAEEFPARAASPFDNEALLSTESMLPSAWQPDAPQVTGADVEAQLDKLFNLEPEPAAPEAPAPPQESQVNLDETVTFVEPHSPAGGGEKRELRESVADWLAQQEDRPEPGAGDTLILPSATLLAGSETSAAAKPEDVFGTLAPEDLPGLSETASIEVVDGGDVAERLDRLFADVPEPEAPAFEPDLPAFPDPVADPIPEPEATMDMPIFELDAADPVPAAEEISSPSLTGNHAQNPEIDKADAASPGAGTVPDAGSTGSLELAPMLDEEEGYPADDEMPSQDAGANVATVTLAEIYFQQGLKEQALQIYRQLLEREPENESVRKRIAEIEASQSEGDRGPDTDPRWPRPGLKVPKRKK